MNFDKYIYNIADAITPIDGRNRHKLQSLIPYFSEFALDKQRIIIELRYLEQLSKYKLIRKLTSKEHALINQLIEAFGAKGYGEIRKIESRTNHDVKAIEEYVKLKLAATSLKDVAEMLHFGLTSDDINNIAYGLIVKDCLKKVIIPEIEKVAKQMKIKAKQYKDIPMLSHTHGQPAVPTTVGKEFLVFQKRLQEELENLKRTILSAKLTGNVGNLNVHQFMYPKINWFRFSQEFIRSFDLNPDLVTTQIAPYDRYLQIFSVLLRINNILFGLCKDLWIYLMFGYFKQKNIKTEVGSTALPHKVNPIYFEGAEGGFGIANSLFEFYIRKLSYSRLQRDLSDSTVRRSWGIAFSYSLLSYQSVCEALQRIEPNIEILESDLDGHWEVLSEAVQNYLRVKGYKNAYETTKKLFRGRILGKNEFKIAIKQLKINKKDQEKLLQLSPEKYTGYAEKLVDKFLI